MRVGQRFRSGEHRLDAAALVGRDALLEEVGVDAELRCEPIDRLTCGACLAALDLTDVLLREPLSCQIGLREAGCDAQLAQAFAQAGTGRSGLCPGMGGREMCLRHRVSWCSQTHT